MPGTMTPDPDRTREPTARDQARVLQFSALVEGATFAGRYTVMRRLGSGGNGEVFRVRDEISDLEYALKVLYPGPVGLEESRARMRRELRNVRELDHPGVVRVYDIGEADGLSYVVMELLDGESLHERLSHDLRVPLHDVVRICRGLLDALDAAHRRNVVHRDVKPANVFLAREDDVDERERVVLLDFGLARGHDDPRLTATGAMIGTPTYMSPEQARGLEPTPASDLYSTGLVLWEMLYGSSPYEADSAVGWIKAHVETPLPRRRRSERTVPGWLDRLARWLLEKRPDKRPASAREALEWLDRRRTPVRRRFAGLVRVRRPLTIAAVAAVVGIVALWPARIELDRRTLVARSVLGVPVRSIPGPHGWTAAVMTDDWPRGRYVLASVTPGATLESRARVEFPSLLAWIDLLTGASSPLVITGAGDTDLLETIRFEGFAPLWSVQRISSTPFRGPTRRRMYAVHVAHHHHYPSALLLTDANGMGGTRLFHSGRVTGVVSDTSPAGEPRLLLTGINNAVGTRWTVFSLPASRLGTIATPPFELDVDADRRPGFYVFLPVYARDLSLTVRTGEDVIEIGLPGGRSIRLDPADGAPLEPERRDGLELDAWRRAQHRLLDVLELSSQMARAADPAGAAAMLEEYAEETKATRVQHGVALGRAARLRLLAGDPDRASEIAERAIALEPEIPGHVQSLLLADTIAGRARSRVDAVRTGDATPLRAPELGRDVVLALIVSGDAAKADRVYGSLFRDKGAGRGFYRILLPAALALERGEDFAAREVTAIERYTEDGTIAFVRALAWKNDEDPSTARAWIEACRRSRGSGHRFPLALLEAWIRARKDRATPDRAALDRDLEEQRRAAARSMTERWALQWAERLHDDLFTENPSG